MITILDHIEFNRKLEGRMTFQGLNISVENAAGSVRSGVGTDGQEWRTKMKVPYGYIRNTEGVDGDHVDVFVGPNQDANKAYAIHIVDPTTGDFDEDKTFLGFSSAKEARACFNEHYDKPERFYAGMHIMSMDDFKQYVLDKDNHGKKIKP